MRTLRRKLPRSRAQATRVAPPVMVVALLQAAAVAVTLWLGASVLVAALIAVGIGVVGAGIAHRTVASLVAGAGLRVARPYEPGEQVRVFVPSLESVQDAEIVRVGPANTTLMTHSGLVVVPNAHMVRGAPDPR